MRRVFTTLGMVMALLGCLFIVYMALTIVLTPSKNMTIEQAQARVPFAICLPTYLPENISPVPDVKADFSDTVEVEIRTIYRSLDNAETLVEIVQTHVPNSHTPDFVGTDQEPTVRALIAWVVGWPNVDSYRDEAEISVDTYIENDIEYGAFELVFPSTVQANLISWKRFPVFYQVFSYLSLSEVQKIASSLTNCNSAPLATP